MANEMDNLDNFDNDEEAREHQNEEEKDLNPFAAPPLPPEEDEEDVDYNPLNLVIIPKIVERKIDDIEVEAILMDIQEDEEDKHQHFFSDQVRFERPRWTKPWFAIVAMTAFAIDASNFNGFIVNVASNGGIVYILTYLFIVYMFAYPMMLLEVIFGQYYQTGMIGIWGLVPMGRGVGAGLFYITFLVIAGLPANSLWSSLMFFTSIKSIQTGNLPWTSCNNDWNTCHCAGTRNSRCLEYIQSLENKTTSYGIEIETHTPGMEHFIGKLLQMWRTHHTDPNIISGITENGNWSTAFGFGNDNEGLGPLIPTSCFLLFVIFTLYLVFNLVDLKYLGYFCTFTMSVTVLVLVMLFCRAVTLDGAFEGLEQYLKPDISKLFSSKMWQTCVQNVFFSVGSGMGIHIVMASFDSLNHNIRRDTIICITIDTTANVLTCVVGFMLVGHLYHLQHLPLPDVFPGGAFIYVTLAECFGSISGSSFFASFFYFTVIVATIDTQVVTLLALSFSLYEEYKRLYPDQMVSKLLFLYGVWGFSFSIALIATTRGGYWVYSFLQHYAFGLSAFFFMFLETLLFSWIYGIEEICIATETVLGYRPSLFIRITWKFLLPILLLAALLHSNIKFADEDPIIIFGQSAPESSVIVGVIMEWIVFCLVVGYGVYILLKLSRGKNKTCLQVMLLFISPEYDHDQIMENTKLSKRLDCRHYTFLQYDDEHIDWKKPFRKLATLMKKLKDRRQAKQAALTQTPTTTEQVADGSKKEKKKKKRKTDGQDPETQTEAESAWDMWERVKKEKEMEEMREEESKSIASKKSIKKKHSKFPLSHQSARPIRTNSDEGKSKDQKKKKKIAKKNGPLKKNQIQPEYPPV